jgi:hypothetical protein
VKVLQVLVAVTSELGLSGSQRFGSSAEVYSGFQEPTKKFSRSPTTSATERQPQLSIPFHHTERETLITIITGRKEDFHEYTI